MNEQQLEEACDEIDRRSEELYRYYILIFKVLKNK